MKLIFTFFFAFSLIFASNSFAKDNDNCKNSPYIEQMRKYAEKINPKMETLYCSCGFKVVGEKKNKYILDESCGFNWKDSKRYPIEVEHIVPVSILRKGLSCKSRNECCIDPIGKVRINDLHNLIHSVGALNGARNNFNYDIIKGEEREFGSCDFEIMQLKKECDKNDPDCKIVEPREDVRGFIARTYLYMQKKYNLALKEREQVIMDAWNKLYPVEEWECVRNKNIAELQGDSNPFIDSTEICKNMK